MNKDKDLVSSILISISNEGTIRKGGLIHDRAFWIMNYCRIKNFKFIIIDLKNLKTTGNFLKYLTFILMILMREGDTPEGASPKGLGWPLHREKKKNLNEMKAGNLSQTQY